MVDPNSDWDLERALRFDARLLAQGSEDEREVGALIMSLALIYNDMKDLLWWVFKLKDYKPKDPALRVASVGQYNGMSVHISRLRVGLLHELMRALEENAKVCEHRLFVEAVQQIRKRYPDAWEDWRKITEVAAGKREQETANKKLWTALVRIRNGVSFHYYGLEAIRRGYQNSLLSPGDDAYVSLGKNAEGTRFYFADAAAQGAMKEALGQTPNLEDQIDKLTEKVNHSLRRLIEVYLELAARRWPEFKGELRSG